MTGRAKRERPQSQQSRFFRGLLCVFLGVACAMAFVVNPTGYVGMSDPPASSTSPLWSALAAIFALLFGYAFVHRSVRPHGAHIVVGFGFGVLNYFGTTLFAYDTWAFLESSFAWGKAALQCMGQGLPMMAAVALLDEWLRAGSLTRPLAGKDCRFPALVRIYRERTTLFCVAVFALCWLPYLVVYYPGTLSWDIGEMLAQFFGLREMDTWHPVFLTWVTGVFLWLGRLMGSDNLGIALFTLLQTVALAYALGYAMACLRRMGASRWVQGAAMGFFAFTPLWGGYAQFVCKDTLYTAALLMFALHTMECISSLRPANGWFLARYGGFALLACLLRGNGIYVALPTALLVVFLGLPKGFHPGSKLRPRLRVGVALGGAILCALLFSSALLPALGIRDETASGLYSVCFQQSARVLRDHVVLPEEYAEIDRVLDAARLPEKYEPWISDPVKYTFRQYGQGAAAEKAALARYRETWLSMLRKYPVSYLEAFVAGNSAYYAFTPKLEGETYNNQAGNRLVFETHPQVATHLGVRVSHIASLEGLRTMLAAFARGWRHIPLLSLLYSCAGYTWLLVAAGVSIGRQRRWRGLVAFAPALLSLGVCLLSPVNDYFRYFLPIVAMAIPLLVFADGNSPLSGRAGEMANACGKPQEAEELAA